MALKISVAIAEYLCVLATHYPLCPLPLCLPHRIGMVRWPKDIRRSSLCIVVGKDQWVTE